MSSSAVIVTVGRSPACGSAVVACGRSTGRAWLTVMNVVETMKKISRLKTTSTIAVMSSIGVGRARRSSRRLRMSARRLDRPYRPPLVTAVQHHLHHVTHQFLAAPLDLGEHLVDAAGEVVVTDEGGNGHDQASCRRHQCLTDTARQCLRVADVQVGELTESEDHAGDGAEQAEQW